MQHTKIPNCLIILLWICTVNFSQLLAQCSTAQGDRSSYGQGDWIGYVYDGVNSFDSVSYQGYISETEIFDESFCGYGCSFSSNGCNVYVQTFTIQFKMRKNFPCGTYQITVGGDDGFRLSIDGGNTYIIDHFTNHPYQTRTALVTLDGFHDLVLDYYQDGGGSRISFDYSLSSSITAGSISGDQIYCGSNSSVDPDPISSYSDATFCGAPFTYQWQSSSDNINFANIPATNTNFYDPPNGLTQTTYYRRLATDGITTFTSNTSMISVNTPVGDQTSFGTDEWLAYHYTARANFDSINYVGYSVEAANFDQSYCGTNCLQTTNGCSFFTDNFSVRYKMRKTFPCGTYILTLGGDDGVRLSIDGGATFIIDDYVNHGYRTNTVTVGLDGIYDLVIEYYEAAYNNRVSFNYTLSSGATGGIVDGGDTYCSSSAVDPSMIGNMNDALICGAVPTYTWQQSFDNVNFTDIASSNVSSFDPPLINQSTYYRRKATAGATTVFSNVVFFDVKSTQGDQVTYGQGFWNAYFYEGENNFDSSNYVGYLTFPDIFDESFCGTNCDIITNGCLLNSEYFSVRLKMEYTLPLGDYQITIGGDDGVRLSIDGGQTYIMNDYSLHSYRTTIDTLTLGGNVTFVFDYYERTGQNRLSFDIVYLGTLPVELTEFSASIEGSDVDLIWTTESELNNDYFDVLRSVNGSDWETIGQVQGAGTTKAKQNYRFRDTDPYNGDTYYRLKQVDFDGTIQMSDIEVVTFRSDNSIELFPNPVDHILTVSGTINDNDVTLYDALGRTISLDIQVSEMKATMNVSNLQSGLYYLHVGGISRSFIKM